MDTFKIVLLSLALLFSFSFTGCQGTNSDVPESNTGGGGEVPVVVDTNDTTQHITIVLPVSSKVLTTNSQVVNIEVRVFDSANNPYSDGNITKVNPNDVLLGRDIGSFDKDVARITNGVATFTYTAPANLDANTSNILFSFYHDSNSSNAKTYTMTLAPEVNQTILTSYKIVSTTESDKNMNLNSTKAVAFNLQDINGVAVPDANVTSLAVTSQNTALAVLKDNLGNTGTSLSVPNKSSFSINVVSNILSGLVPLKVETTFFDANGDEQNLTQIFEIVVSSGPPTAMSLEYVSTELTHDATFTENWVLTLTDKYNNLINTSPSIAMGMIAGYADSSAATSNVANYLYYPIIPGGTLNSNGGKGQFTGTSAFGNVDLVNDVLVTFGTGYHFDTFGKWDIDTINSSSVLNLIDDFNGSTTSSLGYAVGHNMRNETCTGNSVVANVYAKDYNNTLGDNGSLVMRAEYSSYMVGKDVVLWANLVGNHNNGTTQVGIGRKATLRGLGLKSRTVHINKGYEGTFSIGVDINGSVEQYRNANFGYDVSVTADANWSIVSDSMKDGNITDCTSGGRGYVTIRVNSAAVEAGDATLTGLTVYDEF